MGFASLMLLLAIAIVSQWLLFLLLSFADGFFFLNRTLYLILGFTLLFFLSIFLKSPCMVYLMHFYLLLIFVESFGHKDATQLNCTQTKCENPIHLLFFCSSALTFQCVCVCVDLVRFGCFVTFALRCC